MKVDPKRLKCIRHRKGFLKTTNDQTNYESNYEQSANQATKSNYSQANKNSAHQKKPCSSQWSERQKFFEKKGNFIGKT